MDILKKAGKLRTGKKAFSLNKQVRKSALSIANIGLLLKIEANEEEAAKLVSANKELVVQKKEGAEALVIANKEIVHQNAEKGERAAELVIANRDLAFEENEKEKRAAELVIANKELVFQNEEKEKRAGELLLANKELAFQNKEKGKRAKELLVANRLLSVQNKNYAECTDQLTLAHEQLSVQYKQKEKQAIDLMKAVKELKQAEAFQKTYIQGLKEIMFITSHKIRQPVANIMGIATQLKQSLNSPDQLVEMTGFMCKSAEALDGFTRELTTYLHGQEIKMKLEPPGEYAADELSAPQDFLV